MLSHHSLSNPVAQNSVRITSRAPSHRLESGADAIVGLEAGMLGKGGWGALCGRVTGGTKANWDRVAVQQRQCLDSSSMDPGLRAS